MPKAPAHLVTVNGVQYVRRESRDDYFRAVRAETLLESARAALTVIEGMSDATEQSSFREEATAALEEIGRDDV